MSVGVLAFSYHLGDGGAGEGATTVATSSRSTVVTGVGSSATATSPHARAGLAGATRGRSVAAPVTATRPRDAQGALEAGLVSSGAVPAGLVPVLDESEPHTHVVDPRTGGLISVVGAPGSVTKGGRLGPVHTDPLPEGTSLAGSTDTGTLLRRAGLTPSVAADISAENLAAQGSVPAGSPSTVGLSAHVAPSCSGTGTDGKRVQVLYLHDAATSTRFNSVLPILRNEVANVDDVFSVSAAKTGGDRLVRWVHDSSCRPVITDVTVPTGTLGSDFWATVKAVQAQGYDSASRKYLMFADANALCGIGTIYQDTSRTGNANDGGTASYARVDANCWSSSGHSVEAHELTHTLGGVQSKAPNATPSGHCTDESDLMCYQDSSTVTMRTVCPTSQEQLLDCQNNDYFHTGPAAGSFLATNWNVADSGFLDKPATPPTVTVSASKTGAETGDAVTLTAASSTANSYRWSVSASGCSLGSATANPTTVTCAATVTGPVTVSAVGTDSSSGLTGTGQATLSITKAAAPTVSVFAPSTAESGTSFAVTPTARGKAPFSYAWTVGGGCTLSSSTVSAPTVSCSSSTTGQQTVRVTATQADGQTASATATTDVSAPASTTPTASAWTTPSVSRGVLLARLKVAGSSTGVASAPVTLQVRWYGTSTWVARDATLVTNSFGRATGSVVSSKAGYYRFAYAGDDHHLAAISKATFVGASTRQSALRSAPRMASTRLSTVSGELLPGQRVVVQRRYLNRQRWVRIRAVTTNSNGVATARVRTTRAAYVRFVYPGATLLERSMSNVFRIR